MNYNIYKYINNPTKKSIRKKTKTFVFNPKIWRRKNSKYQFNFMGIQLMWIQIDVSVNLLYFRQILVLNSGESQLLTTTVLCNRFIFRFQLTIIYHMVKIHMFNIFNTIQVIMTVIVDLDFWYVKQSRCKRDYRPRISLCEWVPQA